MPFPTPSILTIAPYVGGETALRDAKNPARLMSNENPFGASPAAIAAFQTAGNTLQYYAQSDCAALRAAIAEKYALNAAQIVCGNGSDELLGLLALAYAGAGDEILVSEHSFLVYTIVAKTVGATPVAVPQKNLQIDLDALLHAITPRTKIIYLDNPNNPTGNYLPLNDIRAFCAKIPPHILLVLDGAYAEYAETPDYSSGLELVAEFPNIAVTRTFSKVHGMAAARLGWGYFSPNVADVLNRIRPPFNVNVPVQAAGIAALADTAHVEKSIAHNNKWLHILQSTLPAMGYPLVRTAANFVLMDAGEKADALYAHLVAAEVFTRRVKAYGLPTHLRVSIGTDAEMERFLAGVRGF